MNLDSLHLWSGATLGEFAMYATVVVFPQLAKRDSQFCIGERE